MSKSKIEWTDRTWNIATGCTKTSPGCANCYAERMLKRFADKWGLPADDPFKVTLRPERLDQPMRWKKPSKIFVCSMGDLFHKDVPDEFLHKAFRVMRDCENHAFQVLTKRPQRMKEYIETFQKIHQGFWPLPNVWIGVSAENQEQADKRIPILLQIPAAVRFVSCEPLLGPVDLTPWFKLLDWIITGGESGPGARPVHPDWVSSLRDQCQAAGVPFMFKQWGEWLPDNQTDTCKWVVKPGHPGGPEWAINSPVTHLSPGIHAFKVGKKKAGRLLDGQVWGEYPRG